MTKTKYSDGEESTKSGELEERCIFTHEMTLDNFTIIINIKWLYQHHLKKELLICCCYY